MGKLDRLKADQAARANALEKEGAEDDSRAALIEYNLGPVDAAIDAVNEALARGGWEGAVACGVLNMQDSQDRAECMCVCAKSIVGCLS